MKDSFIDILATNLRAGTPFMSVNTDEEGRCINEIRRAAWYSCDGMTLNLDTATINRLVKLLKDNKPLEKFGQYKYDYRKFSQIMETASDSDQQFIEEILDQGCKVVCWDLVSGFPDGSCANALDDALLKTIDVSFPPNCIFVFKDCHHQLNSPETLVYRRSVRNLFESGALTCLVPGSEYRRHIIFIQPDWQIHRDIQGCLTLLNFDLPDEEHLNNEITLAELSIDDKNKTCPAELKPSICLALRGFTQMEATNALSYCVAKHGGFAPEIVKTIRRLKKTSFQKNSVLDLVDEDDIASVDQIGGYENAVEFAKECKTCWSEEAKKVGLKKPKGCLILGLPGTAKSKFGMIVSKIMELPLIIYDVAAQFGGIVGQTEASVRQSLAQIKAIGPCVVLIDESDKIFSGLIGASGDSGVAQRMLGKILSFMSNDNEEAFIVMTMNRTLGIPPEMLRAGRLDAIFYTTFPTPRERLDILGIHMRKNGADINCIHKNKWDELVKLTDQYVGSELEQIIIKAVRTAFRNRQVLNPTFDELLSAKKSITPVVKLDTESTLHLLAFCKDTATPVSSAEAESKVFSIKTTNSRQIRTNPSNN
jgi:AAA+ superfamily predicted ATPase